MSTNRTIALAGNGISKQFGHVQALVDASIEVRRGEVVALFGDNGAGKSTFLKVLLGIYQPDGGTIAIDGQTQQLSSIRDAQACGVEAVHQDLALAPDLSVVDNMFIGHEIVRGGILSPLGLLNRSDMSELADHAIKRLSIRLPSLKVPIADLSGGQRQAVAIARAVMWARTAVLLDEPTSALGVKQSELVCELLGAVAEQGLGVLVVSHDLPRMLAAADRVAILWRGSTVEQTETGSLTVPDVVATMVGYKGDVA